MGEDRGIEEQLLSAVERAMSSASDNLGKAAAAVEAAQGVLDEQVREARAINVPWVVIAERLGLPSMMVARSQFSHLDPPRRQKVKAWRCPLRDARRPNAQCETVATYRHNLKKHLMGTAGYGGHELPEQEAERVLDDIDVGA